MGGSKRVLVIGGTGTVGTETVRALLERGARVRLLIRSSSASAPAGVESMSGDLLQAESLAAAVVGMDEVVCIAPHAADLEAERMTENLLTACEGGQVPLTYFSLGLPGEKRWERRLNRWLFSLMMPHYATRFRLLERVFDSPLAPRVVGALAFFQNSDFFLEDIHRGVYTEPQGRLGMNRVDAVDIGELIARVALDPPPGRRVFSAEGPQALTGPQIAAIWAQELGRPVTYAGDWNQQWRATLRRSLSGVKAEQAEKTIAFGPWAFVPVSKKRLAATIELLGRPPRSYRDYVRTRTTGR